MTRWNEPITDWTLVRVTPRMRAYTIQEIADEASEKINDTQSRTAEARPGRERYATLRAS